MQCSTMILLCIEILWFWGRKEKFCFRSISDWQLEMVEITINHFWPVNILYSPTPPPIIHNSNHLLHLLLQTRDCLPHQSLPHSITGEQGNLRLCFGHLTVHILPTKHHAVNQRLGIGSHSMCDQKDVPDSIRKRSSATQVGYMSATRIKASIWPSTLWGG